MEKVTCEECNGNVLIIYTDEGYYYECVYCGSKVDESGEPIYGV